MTRLKPLKTKFMGGLYAADQIPRMTECLSDAVAAAKSAGYSIDLMIYTRAEIARGNLYRDLHAALVEAADGEISAFRLTGGFLIDAVLPSDGACVPWDRMFDLDRWRAIAKLVRKIPKETRTYQVMLIHEPATDPFYAISRTEPPQAVPAAEIDRNSVMAAYRCVAPFGSRILLDLPDIRPTAVEFPLYPNPAALHAVPYVQAVLDSFRSYNKPIFLTSFAYGTYTPQGGDYRLGCFRYHQGMTAAGDLWPRLFLSTNGDYPPPQGHTPATAYDLACKHLAARRPRPVCYITQSDTLPVIKRIISLHRSNV